MRDSLSLRRGWALGASVLVTLWAASPGCDAQSPPAGGSAQATTTPGSPSPSGSAPTTPATVAPPASPDELVTSPEYESWSRVKPGTTVEGHYVSISGTETQRIGGIRKKLVSISPESAVLDVSLSMVHDGKEVWGPANKFTESARVPRARLYRPPPGAVITQETITVAGRTVKADVVTWKSKDSAGNEQTEQRVTSVEIPSFLCRTSTQSPTSHSAMEVVEIKLAP